MSASTVNRHTILGLTILCLLAFTTQAYAVQASGAVSILPGDFTLVIGQQVDVVVQVTNASSDTPPTGNAPVPATFDGTLTVTMACVDSTCAVELPGTLSFVDPGGNGCVASVAEVGSCSASGANEVLIDVTNLTLPAGGFVNVAAIRVQADMPVFPPEDGEFAMRGMSGPDDFEACDSVNPNLCATGGAGGSTLLFFPGVCGDGVVSPELGETCDTDPRLPIVCLDDNLEPIEFPPPECDPTDLRECRAPGSPGECTYCGDDAALVGDPPEMKGLDAGEFCDDGNSDNLDDCRNTCLAPFCGDEILDPDETCDPPGEEPDPDNFPGNLCRADCTYCGDGEKQDAEVCDPSDPNDPNAAVCRDNCSLIECGDGILDPDESCDPGPPPVFPTDPPPPPQSGECRDDCTFCGDGILNNDEECDFAAPDADPLCRFDCTLGVCEVKVDKQVSCDGGVTFVDEGLVVENEDGTFSCDGVNGESIVVRYQAANTGTFDVVDCDIAESNPGISGGAVVGDLLAGQTTDFLVDDDQVCSADLAADEPDTATLTCDCATDIGGLIEVGASDEASFACQGEGCLTWTPGFWCNRPFATEFLLPLDVCGITLTNVMVAEDFSAVEDLTFSGRDFKAVPTSPQQLQLIRHCMAAALNLEASFRAGGDCASEFPGITSELARCCEDLCTSGASGKMISSSGCIEFLDRFNNADFDGNELPIPEGFPTSKDNGRGYFPPGPAHSENCREANGNRFVNPDRNLGPRK